MGELIYTRISSFIAVSFLGVLTHRRQKSFSVARSLLKDLFEND